MADVDESKAAEGSPSYAEELGRALIAWNSAENAVQQLLSCLVAQDMYSPINVNASILTSEIGSGRLIDALAAYANEMYKGQEAAAINRVSIYYHDMTSYRNHYIHGIRQLHPGTGSGPIGIVQAYSAKKEIVETYDAVNVGDLILFQERCSELEKLSIGIAFFLFWRKPPGDPNPRPPMPHLPDRPPKFNKPRRHLFAERRRV